MLSSARSTNNLIPQRDSLKKKAKKKKRPRERHDQQKEPEIEHKPMAPSLMPKRNLVPEREENKAADGWIAALEVQAIRDTLISGWDITEVS